MEKLIELVKTYTLALPTGVVAAIVLVVGLYLKKKIFKLIALALLVAAALFYFLKVR